MTRKMKSFAIVVGFVLMFGAVIGIIAHLYKQQTTKTMVGLNYTTGIISTTTGKVGESEKHIVLKSNQKVKDAKIELSEDATVSVKVFYYDKDGKFIADSATTDIDLSNAPETAVYFNIEITPAQVDGEAVTVTLLNMSRYTNQVSVVAGK